MSERVRRYLAGEDRPTELRVGSEREGWRARLANLERLLSEVEVVLAPGSYQGLRVIEALDEVRSMIDGDETTGAP